jgi:hypothetical protein
MPAFAAAYGAGAAGMGLRPADEAIVTIDPARRSPTPGRNVLMVRNVAVRLPSTVECHSSSLSLYTGPGRAVPLPAKAATKSTPPRSDSMRRRTCCVASRLVASAATPSAWPPAARIEGNRVAECPLAASDDADVRAVRRHVRDLRSARYRS